MVLRCVPIGKRVAPMLLSVLLLLNDLTTTKPYTSALFPQGVEEDLRVASLLNSFFIDGLGLVPVSLISTLI